MQFVIGGFSNSAAGRSVYIMLQQQLMDIIVGPDLEPYVFMYLDDIVIVTDSIEKHLRILDEVFPGLFSTNLKIC